MSPYEINNFNETHNSEKDGHFDPDDMWDAFHNRNDSEKNEDTLFRDRPDAVEGREIISTEGLVNPDDLWDIFHNRNKFERNKNIHEGGDIKNIFEVDKGTETENNDNSESDKTEDVLKNQYDSNENKQADVDNKEKNQDLDKIAEKISTAEGIYEYFKKHPDKLSDAKTAIEVLNNPNATPVERRQAIGILSTIKGDILESAVKDVLKDSGLNVEDKHKAVEGEKGKTLPDVVATNETDKPIEVIGTTIEPGEKITIECKCGEKSYLNKELNEHIPKQLAGHEGKSVLLTTSDIKDVSQDKVKEVCAEHDTKQVIIDTSASDVNKAIKEAVQQ